LSTPAVLRQWRVLGFGKHPEIGAAVQARLREAGLAATIVVLTDDGAGDAGLVRELGETETVSVGRLRDLDPEAGDVWWQILGPVAAARQGAALEVIAIDGIPGDPVPQPAS
jgi:hypothetical protein